MCGHDAGRTLARTPRHTEPGLHVHRLDGRLLGISAHLHDRPGRAAHLQRHVRGARVWNAVRERRVHLDDHSPGWRPHSGRGHQLRHEEQRVCGHDAGRTLARTPGHAGPGLHVHRLDGRLLGITAHLHHRPGRAAHLQRHVHGAQVAVHRGTRTSGGPQAPRVFLRQTQAALRSVVLCLASHQAPGGVHHA